MGDYDVLPMVAILAVLFVAVSTPLFASADGPPTAAKARVRTLDGLRGFLALSVFFHHAALYHTYLADHDWGAPHDRLYALLGPFGVSMFFMITGFLFWSQLLEKRGRNDWLKLYVGRLFRIGPLYLVAAGVMMAIVFTQTGLHPRVPLGTLLKQIAQWASLGLSTSNSLNGYNRPGVLLANVTWSLRYEWLFYFSLPLTGLLTRGHSTAWIFPAIGLLGCLTISFFSHGDPNAPSNVACMALFFVGMLTAATRGNFPRVDFQRQGWSVVAALLILTVLALFRTAYQPAPICLLGGAFVLVARGTDLFGLLATRAARRLGDVSFGIYLLQGLILAAVFRAPGATAFALASPLGQWVLTGVAGALLVIVATIAHVLVERPGVGLGQAIMRNIRNRSPSVVPGL